MGDGTDNGWWKKVASDLWAAKHNSVDSIHRIYLLGPADFHFISIVVLPVHSYE